MAITAPTPMMIPSMVSPERSLLRASARSAIRIVARISVISRWATTFKNYIAQGSRKKVLGHDLGCAEKIKSLSFSPCCHTW
jgi:hypothetical protein